MKLERNLAVNPALLGIVPLVNVLFLVVAFYSMSSRFVLQPGTSITLPTSPFALSPPRNAHIVSIAAAPVPAIYLHGKKIGLEELRQELGDARAGDRTLIVKADRGTPYDLAIQVANEGLKLGFSVIFAANPERQ